MPLRETIWDYMGPDEQDVPSKPRKPKAPRTAGCIVCKALVAGEVGLEAHRRDKHRDN